MNTLADRWTVVVFIPLAFAIDIFGVSTDNP